MSTKVLKPLGSLLQEHVSYMYENRTTSIRQFCKDYEIPLTTLNKVLRSDVVNINTDIYDRILRNFNISVRDLVDTYGEYETK